MTSIYLSTRYLVRENIFIIQLFWLWSGLINDRYLENFPPYETPAPQIKDDKSSQISINVYTLRYETQSGVMGPGNGEYLLKWII